MGREVGNVWGSVEVLEWKYSDQYRQRLVWATKPY
jgi:hypothetical protein